MTELLRRTRGRSVAGLAVLVGLVAAPAAPAAARPASSPAGPATTVSSNGFAGALPTSAVKGLKSSAGSGRLESTSSAGRVAWDAEKARTARPVRPAPGATTESIIGLDTRTTVDNTSFPSRAVVLILWNVPGGTASCSGALIGPSTVVTAGHCVAPGDNTGFYATSTYRVYPGVNYPSAPYGGCLASNLFSTAGWVGSGDTNFDLGGIKLACTIGNTVGYMGALVEPAAALLGAPLRIVGYPGEKGGTEWTALGTIGATTPSLLFYDDDTTAGMSGSPAYRYRPPGSAACVGYCIRGIHTNGVGGAAPPFSTMNHGTRMSQGVLNTLAAWLGA